MAIAVRSPQPIPSKDVTFASRNSPKRVHALLCVLLLLVCVLLTRPYVELGVNDDWSFIRTAQLMAQTGHMAYNGWAAMILGWQVLLGALFIKLFGFSFTIVRLPIFLLALCTTYLLHRVLARFGLNAWSTALVTLTCVLSPVFLPLVFTFMSDVSGIFCLLLCLYACQRALQAGTYSAALGWLYFAAITNILDGTVRQIVWLGVLVMVPCTAWLMRNRKGMLLHGAGLWLAGCLSIFACLHWYAQQPYSTTEKLIDVPLTAGVLVHLASMMLRAFLSLLLFSLPVLVVFPLRLLDLGRQKSLRAFSIIGVLMVLAVAFGFVEYRSRHSLDAVVMPWLVNCVSTRGILQFGEIVGLQPVVLHIPVRALFTLLTIFSGLCCAAYILLTRNSEPQRTVTGTPRSLSWYQTAMLLLPFSLAYVALLAPRAASTAHTIFDRYLIPIVLVLAIFVLRYLQEHSTQKSQWASVAVLLPFTFYAVAGTHDLYALARARVAAAAEVTQSGVPRTALDGGFEYDGWTQLLVAGYVNDPHIHVPAGAYHPVPDNTLPCQHFFQPWTPAIHPQYALTFDYASCWKPSNFAAVAYRTWLPPFEQKVYVRRVD